MLMNRFLSISNEAIGFDDEEICRLWNLKSQNAIQKIP